MQRIAQIQGFCQSLESLGGSSRFLSAPPSGAISAGSEVEAASVNSPLCDVGSAAPGGHHAGPEAGAAAPWGRAAPPLPSSLDIHAKSGTAPATIEFSRRRPALWDSTQRRCFHRVRSLFTYWLSHHYKLSWLNLTTARGGTAEELAYHFKRLRQSIERKFGFKVEFFEVQTREGNGVIHAVVGCRDRKFYLPQRWLSAEWKRIHGAPIVWISQIGSADSDGHKLSKYMVSQYCAGQRGFVRFSWSWWLTGVKVGKSWKALKRLASVTFRDDTAKWGWRCEFAVSFKDMLSAWEALLRDGQAMMAGVLLEFRSGELVEVF